MPQGALRVVAHGGDGEALFSHGVFGLMILGLYAWHVYCILPEVLTLCRSLIDAIASVVIVVAALFTVLT